MDCDEFENTEKCIPAFQKCKSPQPRITSFASINSLEYDEDLTPKKAIPLQKQGPFSQSKTEYIDTYN